MKARLRRDGEPGRAVKVTRQQRLIADYFGAFVSIAACISRSFSGQVRGSQP